MSIPTKEQRQQWRELCVEVCHDLMNRALRNEADEIPDLAYSKIYRDQEAAIRAMLDEVDELEKSIRKLRNAADTLDIVFDAPIRVLAIEGQSVVGEWISRPDGLWALRLNLNSGASAANAELARWMPVIEAAKEWSNSDVSSGCGKVSRDECLVCKLLDAVVEAQYGDAALAEKESDRG